jgi:hypothetical protein
LSPLQFLPEVRSSPRPPRKRRGRFVMLLVLLAAAGGAVYMLVLRESDPATDDAATDLSTATRGEVVDEGAALPDLTFDRPQLTSATWTETMTDLVLDDAGAAQIASTEINVSMDYSLSMMRMDLAGSGPGNERNATVVITPEHSYSPGDAFGAPWTRSPRTSQPSATSMDSPDYLDVYQDRVTETMRANATNVTTTTSVVGGVSMTAFTFDIDLADLPGMDTIDVPSIVNPDLFKGHMEITIDDTGLVRHWHFALDEALMREALAAGSESTPLTFGGDVTSVNQPVDIQLPTDFIDEPASSEPIVDVPKAAPAPNDACLADQRTLEVATQAWYMDHGSSIAPTETQLVTDGFLRAEFTTYDLVDGTIIAVAGGPCVELDN